MLIYNEISDFYKGKNILITGHTGFKGSWLAFWLYLVGANVIGYAQNPKTDNDFFNINAPNKRFDCKK
jgi:CDP-glucose 4,6-dehydratase